MGLQVRKEYARECGGAHKVDGLSKDMVSVVQESHHQFKKWKAEEAEVQRKKNEEEKNKLVSR